MVNRISSLSWLSIVGRVAIILSDIKYGENNEYLHIQNQIIRKFRMHFTENFFKSETLFLIFFVKRALKNHATSQSSTAEVAKTIDKTN